MNINSKICLAALIFRSLSLCAGDTLIFGNAESELAHGFVDGNSRIIKGGDGVSGREILPPGDGGYQSRPLKFRLAVDPDKDNYLTVKLWGGDINENLLIAHIDGRQFGYRHLGDYDILDHGSTHPQFYGRFYYVTHPIPRHATKGRTSVEVELRANGPIWAYGRNFDQYQKAMKSPSRGIYKLYVQQNAFFEPEADDSSRQVEPAAPEPEKVDFSEFKQRVNGELDKLLKSRAVENQMRAEFMGGCYFIPWTVAYRNPRVISGVIASVDAYYRKFAADPRLAADDKTTWNPGWFGFGPLAQTVVWFYPELEKKLAEQISDGKGSAITRRRAWSEMIKNGMDHLLAHRRGYSNQTMIIDRNIYISNRALTMLDPDLAIPEEQALNILKEAAGILPWSGSFKDGVPTWPLGRDYRVVSKAYLTRELGYVGGYGEINDLMAALYQTTCPRPGEPGDADIRTAMEKMFMARACFRYPALDAEGRRTMRLETVVGWRDVKNCGEVIYAQRINRDGGPFDVASMLMTPEAVGMSKHMLEDHQFFNNFMNKVKSERGGNAFRTLIGLARTPEAYEAVSRAPDSTFRMPMADGQADFVFADAENGVVAVKHGREILYASLYWRARHAVNSLGKVHYLTPEIERIATVRTQIDHTPGGNSYVRKNWTNFGFANGGGHIHYPDEKSFRSLHAGEEMPVAASPDGHYHQPGTESPFAGRGEFYRLDYGPFIIAINASERPREMELPDGEWHRLGAAEPLAVKGNVTLEPGAATVLRRNSN